MARQRRGLPVHGWLIIDKPVGMTSTQVVGAVRRITGAAKAGHGGTLDPLASGILPIALGEATKTVSYVMDGAKRYRFTVRWGETTETDDAEGPVVEQSAVRPEAAEIEGALGAFIGDVEQLPPAYSALKVGGARAYDLARRGETPDLQPRSVRIDALRLVETPDADHASLEIDCGKGTYVRAVARDLARALGTCGHVTALRRLKVGGFSEDRAISLDKLATMWQFPAPNEHLLPILTALDDIPALAITEPQADRLRHGQPVTVPGAADGTVCVTTGGEPVALAEVDREKVRPLRVFNL
ncbi:tRNA pseudouridine(55) synthase TruB [Oceanibacterium hippocampi]|uniref:tRNA pseudouridine synthase B n=1 Tax=Oceanibacterium hippocampi TaxID=745714 RepID=A0A1Y5RNS6_9PROT|nr:tRNA pseudouridine(55) synthase TruB [Oceanibacterium hippocampi]SLN19067.1 tRNA pseudouridine synthase B [Oceanibacterium hippocampi]